MENKATDSDNELTAGEKMQRDMRRYEAVMRHREVLAEAASNQSRSFDKYVLTLGAGALGISLVFLKDISPGPDRYFLWTLYLSWICFIVSMTTTLVSFLCGKAAYDREIKEWNNRYNSESKYGKSVYKNVFSGVTKFLNITSFCAFILGVLFLCAFATQNLQRSQVKLNRRSVECQMIRKYRNLHRNRLSPNLRHLHLRRRRLRPSQVASRQ